MFHSIQLWWDAWNLRGVILFSLFLQTFLFFSAPLRKRTANSLVTIPIWLAYNLADATAIFGVGLIAKPCGNALGAYANPELVAFWAPFLLLHLGGPDTITAFTLEDNELWKRHLLQLVVQLAASAYVFILTLSPTPNIHLWLPTLLVFISALMKSAERTRSLYLASWRRFRDSMLEEPDPGPNYRKLPSSPEIVEAPIPEPSVEDDDILDPDLLSFVYQKHFKTVKGLIADLKFSFRERDKSRLFFLKLTPKQAFGYVTIELNFLYDILFTKTYTLLLGTVVHDVIATFAINASDWSFGTMKSMRPARGGEGLSVIHFVLFFLAVLGLFLAVLWGICFVIGGIMRILFFGSPHSCGGGGRDVSLNTT